MFSGLLAFFQILYAVIDLKKTPAFSDRQSKEKLDCYKLKLVHFPALCTDFSC